MTAPLPPTSPGDPNVPEAPIAHYLAGQAEMASSVPPELPPVQVPSIADNPHWAEISGQV